MVNAKHVTGIHTQMQVKQNVSLMNVQKCKNCYQVGCVRIAQVVKKARGSSRESVVVCQSFKHAMKDKLKLLMDHAKIVQFTKEDKEMVQNVHLTTALQTILS